MKSTLLLLPALLFASPVEATDYYVALWDTAATAISTDHNSDANTVVGYNIGDWPTAGSVTTAANLEGLITVIEGDTASPHRLFLWRGTYDDASDYLLLDSLNTQSLTVIGQGDNTVLDGSAISESYAVSVNGRSGMTFERFKVTGGEWAFRFADAGFSDYARNLTGITIDNVTMENQIEYGVRVSCAWDTLTNFVLKNSTITDDDKSAIGIRFITYNDCNINDIEVRDNYLSGLEKGIQFYSLEEHAGLNNSSPYNVIVDGNSIIDTENYGIVFQSGLKAGTGTTSYVSNNYLEDIGEPTEPNVNGIQLSWCHDLIVENNVINRVVTSDPDGHGIIADWAWRDNDYLSDGVLIRNNIIYGLDSLDCLTALSAGVNVYKAINTVVHHNVSYNNCVGFKLTRPQSVGTSFYNNTAYANIVANARIDILAPASVWKNNIFDGGGITPYGLIVGNNNTVIPTMSNNIFHNHTIASKYDGQNGVVIPLGAGSSLIDPQLSNNYELAETSPAIGMADDSVLSELESATSINGILIKTSSGDHFPFGGGSLDIGSFEYMIDFDTDGVGDALDNCSVVPNGPVNSDDGGIQIDTNGDGFGNLCDQDLNNDLAINFTDLQAFKQAFLSTVGTPNWDPDADFNNDGAINFGDTAVLRAAFFGTPGPSGLAP